MVDIRVGSRKTPLSAEFAGRKTSPRSEGTREVALVPVNQLVTNLSHGRIRPFE